jgi:hypothetical protein
MKKSYYHLIILNERFRMHKRNFEAKTSAYKKYLIEQSVNGIKELK